MMELSKETINRIFEDNPLFCFYCKDDRWVWSFQYRGVQYRGGFEEKLDNKAACEECMAKWEEVKEPQ